MYATATFPRCVTETMSALLSAEYCAVLVAINSIMQIVLYAPLAVFYIKVSQQWQPCVANLGPTRRRKLLGHAVWQRWSDRPV